MLGTVGSMLNQHMLIRREESTLVEKPAEWDKKYQIFIQITKRHQEEEEDVPAGPK